MLHRSLKFAEAAFKPQLCATIASRRPFLIRDCLDFKHQKITSRLDKQQHYARNPKKQEP
jgi:hypothetical protein